MRKIAVLIICLTTVCLFMSRVHAETKYIYKKTDGSIVISQIISNEPYICIPSKIEGLPVTEIGENAFTQDLISYYVFLPETVTKISDYAFARSSVVSIFLPSSLRIIGEGSFMNSNLTSLYIPKTVTQIGQSAFSGCNNLQYVCCDAKIDYIPYRAFFECVNLIEVWLSDSIKTIQEEAFYYCVSLTSINLPPMLKRIETHAFAFCDNLDLQVDGAIELGIEPFLSTY